MRARRTKACLCFSSSHFFRLSLCYTPSLCLSLFFSPTSSLFLSLILSLSLSSLPLSPYFSLSFSPSLSPLSSLFPLSLPLHLSFFLTSPCSSLSSVDISHGCRVCLLSSICQFHGRSHTFSRVLTGSRQTGVSTALVCPYRVCIFPPGRIGFWKKRWTDLRVRKRGIKRGSIRR